MEDKQIGVPTNVAVFIDYENVYKALLEEKTNVLRLAFFEKLRKWCSEHQRRVVRIVVYCNFDTQIAITSWTPRGKNLAHGWSRRIYP